MTTAPTTGKTGRVTRTTSPAPTRLLTGVLTTLLTGVLTTLLAVAALTWTGGAAAAHSVLVSMSPKDKATMSTPPTRVVLTFNEDVNAAFSVIKVVDATGSSVADGSTQVAGPVVSLPLRAGLSNGTYTLTYKVVSTDGHPISGRSTFTVAGSAPSTATAPNTAASAAPTASPLGPAVASSTPLATGNGAATTTSDTGGSLWAWVVAAVVVLILLGGVLWVLLRRRRGPDA